MLVPSTCQNLAQQCPGTETCNLERGEPSKLCHWRGEGSKKPTHFCKMCTQAQRPRRSNPGFLLPARGKETPGAVPAAGGCVIRAELAVPSTAVPGSPAARLCCALPAPGWDPCWQAASSSVSSCGLFCAWCIRNRLLLQIRSWGDIR